MKNNKFVTGIIAVATVFALSACSEKEAAPTPNDTPTNTEVNEGSMSHDEMNHTGSGETPSDLAAAENPTYPVDSKATIETDHMKGMKGATATITGAYDTTVYMVSYTPTTGGDMVKNHKWVIHEEIADHGDKPFKTGEDVVLEADHMDGMKGAKAVIESAEQATVYMLDYKDTVTGKDVKNHKWVTEDELSPIK